MHDHPVQVVVSDDLERSRATVFFRLLLAIPHFIWLALWSIGAVVAAICGWFAALFAGRLPGAIHRFLVAYVRYVAHLFGYLTLIADPYPDFDGRGGAYPFDVVLPAEPVAQPRWRILLRILLAIPAFLVSATLGGGGFASATQTRGGGNRTTSVQSSGLSSAVAVLGWFASVFTGRMPRGLRDAGAYAIGYQTQVWAYTLLLTDRYPNADPTAMLFGLERPAKHPVHLVGDAADLRRSRVTVFFRLPLAIPHLAWLILWGVLADLVAIAQWFVTLVRGRPAAKLHAFLARYVRYTFQVSAFLSLAVNPFPGFTGLPGLSPLDVVLPPPGRQNRWKTGFRIVLAVPALIVGGTLTAALLVDVVLTWFAALLTGKAPEGLRNLSAYALRYEAQANAYVFLLTDTYPHASPLEGGDDVDDHGEADEHLGDIAA